MPVHLYEGLPRHGKSYSAVEQVIIPALRRGRIVVTNLAMKRDEVVRDIPAAEHLLRDFPTAAISADPDLISDHCPPGAVIVLDEVWRFWPAGKKVDQIPEAFKSFIAEHGHRVDAQGEAQQIVLVTQNSGQIAAFARNQVEQTFRTIKLSNLGFSKKFRTDIYAGAVGPAPPVSQRIRQVFGTFKASTWKYYTSHTMSESSEEGANEAALDQRGSIWARPLMYAVPVLVIGLAWFGVHTLANAGKGKAIAGGAPAVGGAGGSAPPLGLQTFAPPRAVDRPASSRPRGWWVSGELVGMAKLGDVAMLTDGERSVFVELASCQRSKFDTWCPAPDGTRVSARSQARPGIQGPRSQADQKRPDLRESPQG